MFVCLLLFVVCFFSSCAKWGGRPYISTGMKPLKILILQIALVRTLKNDLHTFIRDRLPVPPDVLLFFACFKKI